MRYDWDQLKAEILKVRQAVESIDAEIGDIKQSDIPPCVVCGGKLEINYNARQRRWYAWCPLERRSWGHGEEASQALAAHKTLAP